MSVLTVQDGILSVLLISRSDGTWALPETLPRPGEGLDEAARRLVAIRAPNDCLEQLRAYSTHLGEADQVLLVGYTAVRAPGEPSVPCGARTQWWPVAAPPPLPPEHAAVLQAARLRLRARANDITVLRCLIPDQFSLTELQAVQEAVVGKLLDKRNFRKGVLGGGLVQATAQFRRRAAHRPARLYRFAGDEPA